MPQPFCTWWQGRAGNGHPQTQPALLRERVGLTLPVPWLEWTHQSAHVWSACLKDEGRLLPHKWSKWHQHSMSIVILSIIYRESTIRFVCMKEACLSYMICTGCCDAKRRTEHGKIKRWWSVSDQTSLPLKSLFQPIASTLCICVHLQMTIRPARLSASEAYSIHSFRDLPGSWLGSEVSKTPRESWPILGFWHKCEQPVDLDWIRTLQTTKQMDGGRRKK